MPPFFAHPWMLFWAFAAAAPILIHLLNRRRYREQPWAAMEYLLAAMRKNVRRVRVEQWLLLALRTLLILFLVLAVADPVVRGLGLANVVGTRTHRVFLLDGSYSMDYRPDDVSRFEHAKRMIGEIVERSPQGDGFSLVLMSVPSRVIVRTPAFDKREFLSELDSVRLPHGGGDLAGALRSAEGIIAAARQDERKLARDEVYVVSDLGRTSWRPRDRARLSALAERARALTDTGATLTIVDVGQPDEGNLVVSDLTSLDPVTTTRGEATFQAQLRNLGRAARERERVTFYVDGARAMERTVKIPAGGTVTETFRARFDAPGDHVVEARVEGDRLDVDNHRYWSAAVKDQLRVLVVDGRPRSGDTPGAAEYLRVALAPSDQRNDGVEVQVASESTWLEEDLNAFDCVILAEVKEFTAAEARALTTYLAGGGGLLTVLGPDVNTANYNERLAGILPAVLGDTLSESTRAIDPLGYRHPIVAPFRDQEQAGLLTTPVSKYVRVTPSAERRAEVAAAFSGGDPFIVQAPAGRGVSMLLTTSASARDWTLLPVWPSFVPLVQEMLIAAIAGREEDRNLVVGQPLRDVLPMASLDANVALQLPGERQATVKATSAEDHAQWAFEDTSESGVYRAAWHAPVEGNAVYAVNVDTAESDLARVDEAILRSEVWPGIEFEMLTDRQEDATGSSLGRGRGAALHFGLLTAALALMFLESSLACYFGARQA